jgi:hypothetical protein
MVWFFNVDYNINALNDEYSKIYLIINGGMFFLNDFIVSQHIIFN